MIPAWMQSTSAIRGRDWHYWINGILIMGFTADSTITQCLKCSFRPKWHMQFLQSIPKTCNSSKAWQVQFQFHGLGTTVYHVPQCQTCNVTWRLSIFKVIPLSLDTKSSLISSCTYVKEILLTAFKLLTNSQKLCSTRKGACQALLLFQQRVWVWMIDHVSEHEKVPIVPDSFLGGSAPHLWYLYLVSHSFIGTPLHLRECRMLERHGWHRK